MGIEDDPDPSIWALWAKSNAGGRPHSLPAHLLDTAAVGELVWDEFMAPGVRARLDQASGGQGRDVLRALCGLHDLGKATPGFQVQRPDLAAVAADAGWQMPRFAPPPGARPRHGASGAHILRSLLARRVPGRWLLPLITGHHGVFIEGTGLAYDGEWQHGPGQSWISWQQDLARWILTQLDLTVATLDTLPSRPVLADQLAVAGFLSMADWIASSDQIPGLGTSPLTLDEARERAARAWRTLGLRGGWRDPRPVPFSARFGKPARPFQQTVIELAEGVSGPCLLVVEAPMGEGKTEAALAAVERFVAAGGPDGMLFGMPTQGTTDAMYDRCVEWARSVDPSVPVSLLHGKAMANETWREVLGGTQVGDVFDCLGDDPYGLDSSEVDGAQLPDGPSEWLLGRHRPLLSPVAVATVDQPLVAATDVKYVALRVAGLVGKVLVIDEVHSYDVFMGTFLDQLLRLCRDLAVPVVLMSATLPPAQRGRLVNAYATGLRQGETCVELPPATGYPVMTRWTPSGVEQRTTSPRRADLPVDVRWLEIEPGADITDVTPVVSAARESAGAGAVVLVILNTVRRAQDVYGALAECGVERVILHGRLTTAERARRTADLVDRLGADRRRRPAGMIVVATQIAEQSFDVDADMLISDIAPMDLLLQRVGRLHRHSAGQRPPGHESPRVMVAGVSRSGGPPAFVPAFEYLYERAALMRSVELVGRGSNWPIPSAVPGLVAMAYDEERPWPTGWEEAGAEATRTARDGHQERLHAAEQGVLHIFTDHRRDLADLHETGTRSHVAVRDGEPSREVCLVRRTPSGYSTLAGRPLGPTGEAVSRGEVAREVLGDSVRFRERDDLGAIDPLPGWADSALLAHMPALVLDAEGRAEVPVGAVRYDGDIGLVIERTR